MDLVREYAFAMAPGSEVRNARGSGRLRRLARARKVEAGVGSVSWRRAAMSCWGVSWCFEEETSGTEWVAYMSAMAVADVGAVHGVGHQDVNKSVVEGPAVGLEDLEIGKSGFDVSLDGVEPGFLFAWFAVSLAARDFLFDVLGPLQSFGVCAIGEG